MQKIDLAMEPEDRRAVKGHELKKNVSILLDEEEVR